MCIAIITQVVSYGAVLPNADIITRKAWNAHTFSKYIVKINKYTDVCMSIEYTLYALITINNEEALNKNKNYRG